MVQKCNYNIAEKTAELIFVHNSVLLQTGRKHWQGSWKKVSSCEAITR